MIDAFERAKLAQFLAADPQASAFVTANAGSGKTKVLIDRVARLLLSGDRPSAFLCITYTKAAAAEMRRRLFERLGAWATAGDDVLRAELRQLVGEQRPIGAEELSRARALFAHALETPGGLKIQTIHSFCERLLRRFPLEAGVSAGFEVLEDRASQTLIARAWASIAAQAAPAAALAHLAERIDEARLDTLISALTARRRALRAQLSGRTLADAIDHVRARHQARQDRAQFVEAFFAAAPDLMLAQARLAESGRADRDLGARIAWAVAGDERERFERHRAIFFTAAGDEPRAKIVTKSFAKDNPAIAALFDAEQARVIAANEALKGIDRADDCAALLTLGEALVGEYGRAKSAIGALDFEDLIERAEILLTRAGAAAWVLYKLDGGLDHVLIDEGQDTSPAQWGLLAPLQSEFFVGAGARTKTRTVFAVGDAKQSIYSFQGADPARFMAEAKRLAEQANAARLAFHAPDMTMSFRSTPTVLAAVDAVFETLELGETIDASACAIRHDAKRSEDIGLVEFWPLAPRTERSEPQAWTDPVDAERGHSATTVMANAIAKRVSDWIASGAQIWDRKGAPRPMEAGDVIALVRSRGAVFDALLKGFRKAGLSVAGPDQMRLKDEIAVQDVLAFARLALDPHDDLALACALKSPLVGLNDDDLMELAAARARGEHVIDRLRAAPAYAPARAVLEQTIAHASAHPFDFFALLLEGLDAQGQSGWRRMLDRLGRAARDPLEELLNRALACDPPCLQAFLCALEADDAPVKREMETTLDAVRVMTVHGAKGLEAPVVILADTTAGFESGDLGLFERRGELYWSARKGDDDAVTAEARAQTMDAARREHLRLLYVAMTRARDRLIICGHERGNLREGRAAGAWHELVEAGLTKIARPIDTPFGEGLALGEDKRAPRLARAPCKDEPAPLWLDRPAPLPTRVGALTPSHLSDRTPAGFSARAALRKRFRRGKLIHGLLQRLPDIDPARRRQAGLAWLRTKMAPGEDGEALLAETLKVLTDPRFAPVFGPASRAEAPIVGEVGGRMIWGIIDRLVIGPREILVLDFKTDRPAPDRPDAIDRSYLGQLGLYAAVLGKAFPAHAIRCALLWTEAPTLMEAPAPALRRVVAELLG